jgi:hypothetical protein
MARTLGRVFVGAGQGSDRLRRRQRTYLVAFLVELAQLSEVKAFELTYELPPFARFEFVPPLEDVFLAVLAQTVVKRLGNAVHDDVSVGQVFNLPLRAAASRSDWSLAG